MWAPARCSLVTYKSMATIQAAMSQVEQEESPAREGPFIALISPYTGGNLGDAAIQDSMISNLRRRMPEAQFLGITLDCQNFIQRHGNRAFPLLTPVDPRLSRVTSVTEQGCWEQDPQIESPRLASRQHSLIRILKRMPGLLLLARRARNVAFQCRRETKHWISAYRMLRTQDLLLLSGGGQLDEEYGGPWIFPYACFKWTLLARVAGVPCGMASLGAGRIETLTSKMFLSAALRLSSYRSFREDRSKRIATTLFAAAENDPVVPDLAFSLPASEMLGAREEIRTLAKGRPVVAVSPIAYAKPINWPTPDRQLYDRYLQQMAQVLIRLLNQGYFVMIACSSLGDDETVIPDLMNRFEMETGRPGGGEIYFPTVASWRDFIAVLREADYLVASRLHGTILAVVANTPAVAISFDPKVDWVMEDLDLTEYLLHIRDFLADDVIRLLERLKAHRPTAVERIAAFRRKVLSHSESRDQYDSLANLALEHHQAKGAAAGN